MNALQLYYNQDKKRVFRTFHTHTRMLVSVCVCVFVFRCGKIFDFSAILDPL
jgi:hypothetical protein